MEDLLTSHNSKKQLKFILVEGPPGIGKSTFAWELCRKWDEIKSLNCYHAVVLLRLREKWVLNATPLSDLFRYPHDPEFSKRIADDLHESHGCNLLLVLDGFDEVSHCFHNESVVKYILCRQLLPECTLVLTTRPSAMHILQGLFQPQIDKHVEIIGFTEKERMTYITECFSKEPEYQVKFLKYILRLPHIQSMMYVPLNCAIIAQVYYESQSSHHLAVPKTRTELYKALTHCILVRYIKSKKESSCDVVSMFPEGLNDEDFKKFKILAKFAFESYHKEEPSMVTFFKEDIPDEFTHFGFMNECCEMYASKGIEQTFSFLHLSIQEYLAAWYLANGYGIDFQVAYHRLALGIKPTSVCKGFSELEEVELKFFEPLKDSLVEPAIFLAGITGWKNCSEDGRNHWEEYLSQDTQHLLHPSVILRSLYEAQNPAITSHYFSAGSSDSSSNEVAIGELSQLHFSGIHKSSTLYDCYALSYCIAHFSNQFTLSLAICTDEDIRLLDMFLQGLGDHCKCAIPAVRCLRLLLLIEPLDESDKLLHWILKTKFITEVKELKIEFTNISNHLVNDFLKWFVKLESLQINIDSLPSWNWVSALESLNELRVLHISGFRECIHPPSDMVGILTQRKLSRFLLDIKLPPVKMYDICSKTDVLINSLITSPTFNNLIEVQLPNISRETMSGIHTTLLHCPSLESLTLKRTNLGYEGVLYLCSALIKNRSLKHLVIDDLHLPPTRFSFGNIIFSSFLKIKEVTLARKTTCTEFLMKLNNIVKQNNTLETMNIKSGLFQPITAGEDGEYCQWTGHGPLQQFNMATVASGVCPQLKKSFSLSDLVIQPQANLYWDRKLDEAEFGCCYVPEEEQKNVNQLSMREHGIVSFTSPESRVLQSFSDLDPRIRECLGISNLVPYVIKIVETFRAMQILKNIKEYAIIESSAAQSQGMQLAQLLFYTWQT